MSKRKYTIRRGEGLHLTDRQREILGNAWNRYVNRLVPVSVREFARLHGVHGAYRLYDWTDLISAARPLAQGR